MARHSAKLKKESRPAFTSVNLDASKNRGARPILQWCSAQVARGDARSAVDALMDAVKAYRPYQTWLASQPKE